ncbi:MAG: hypothetical protein ACHQ53_18410, partial [Polyangiales bacterium]
MNLGFMHGVDRQKMPKSWQAAGLGALALSLFMPALAVAQDMSFDLNEAEQAGGDKGGDKGKPATPPAEGAEGGGEAKGKAGAGASAGG